MHKKIIFPLKLIAALIMLQTLFYKFGGAQESIDLFTKLAGKNEALLRIGIGILELIAAILLFIPKKIWIGANGFVRSKARSAKKYRSSVQIPNGTSNYLQRLA